MQSHAACSCVSHYRDGLISRTKNNEIYILSFANKNQPSEPIQFSRSYTKRSTMSACSRPSLLFCFVLAIIVPVFAAALGSAEFKDEGDTLKDGHGVVGFRVINNSHFVGYSLIRWSHIQVQSLDSPKSAPIRLFPLEGGYAGNQTFIGPLEPGRYRISKLYAYEIAGDVSLHAEFDTQQSPTEFQIEAGAFTDAGLFVYQRGYLDPSIGRYIDDDPGEHPAIIVRVSTDSDSLADLQKLYPRVAVRELPESEQPISLEAHTMAFETLQSVAFPPRGETEADGATRYLLTRTGLIHRRDTNKTWSTVDTGAMGELTSLSRMEDGSLWVGGERGTLLRSATDSDAWNPIRSPVPRALIIWIGSEEDGTALIVTAEPGQISVWRAKDIASPEWLRLATVDAPTARRASLFGSAYTPPPPRAVGIQDNQLLISTGAEVYWVDIRQGTSKRVSRKSFRRIERLWNGFVVAEPVLAQGNWWPVMKPLISENNGRKWKTVRKRKLIGLPFIHDDELIGVAGFIPSATRGNDGWSQHPRWLTSPSGRHRWKVRSRMPDCGRFYPEISHPDAMFIVCETGLVFLSQDGGQTWERDRDAPGIGAVTHESMSAFLGNLELSIRNNSGF